MRKNYFQKKPLYLFGQSMGSFVVRRYIQTYDAEIKKLVLSGSVSENVFAFLALPILKLMKAIKGDRYRSELVTSFVLGVMAI